MKARDFLRYFLLGAAIATISRMVRRDFSFPGKVVFITGGSRGLGLALAREFARLGARIALVARDPSELQRAQADLEARGAEVWTDVCDLRQRDQIEDSIRDATAHFGSLDVLVNNAGEITVGPLETMTPTDFHDAMEIHFWAAFYAMNTAIPQLRRGRGRIVNIVSIGGKIAVPHLAPYCASKFALAGLSDAFRAELAKDGVSVTSVFPGLMRTGSHVNAWFRGKHREEFAWFSLGAGLPISSISAGRAAQQIVEACRRGQPQLMISAQARAVALASSLFPNTMARLVSLSNRFLPKAPEGPPPAREVHSGWDSQSKAIPSAFTRLADEATKEYNELRGHEPVPPLS